MKREWTGLLLLGIVTLCFGGATLLFGGFAISFLFYITLGLFVYEMIVYFTCLRGLEVERELSSERLTAGERLQVRMKIMQKMRLPFYWLLVKDHSELEKKSSLGYTDFLVTSGKEAERRDVNTNRLSPKLPPNTIEYRLYDVPRGRYHFQGMECVAGDFFGIVQRKKWMAHSHTLVVYPRLQPVTHWNPHAAVHGNQEMRAQRHNQDTITVHGIRDYQVGDRLQQIHWKLSARGQGLKVKEFEKEITTEILFILDQREAAYKGKAADLFEQAVSLTASLIHTTLQKRIPTSLLLTGEYPVSIPANHHPDSFLSILEYLVDVKANGHTPLSAIFVGTPGSWRKERKIVLITSRLDTQSRVWLQEMKKRSIEVEVISVAEGEVRRNG